MPKIRLPYPAEFRQRIIKLARAGRTPAKLSREFGPTAQSIANWIAQDARDRGKPLPGKEGPTSAEREERVRLRRQLRQVQQERDILAKVIRPGSPPATRRRPRRLRARERKPADASNALSVRGMCRVLKVSPSGYYDWRMPQVRAELREAGHYVSQASRPSDAQSVHSGREPQARLHGDRWARSPALGPELLCRSTLKGTTSSKKPALKNTSCPPRRPVYGIRSLGRSTFGRHQHSLGLSRRCNQKRPSRRFDPRCGLFDSFRH